MSEALDQIIADLDAIRRFIEIESFIGRLSSVEIPYSFQSLLSSGCIDREFHKLVLEGSITAKGGRASIPVVIGTLVLYIAGRLESFIKEKIEVAARDIGNKCGCFDRLPKEMKINLLSFTADVVKNPRKYGHGENGVKSFIRRLSAGYTRISEHEPVNFECISITDTNMRPDLIKEICERIGFKNVWENLAAQTQMRTYFCSMEVSVVSRDAQEKLKRLMDDRNSVAHPAAATTFPTSSTVLDYVKFIEVFCREFEDVIDTYVAVVQPQP